MIWIIFLRHAHFWNNLTFRCHYLCCCPVPISLPRASRNFPKIKTRNDQKNCHLEIRNLGLILNFESVECLESGKEKSRNQEFWHLKIPGQLEPDVMVEPYWLTLTGIQFLNGHSCQVWKFFHSRGWKFEFHVLKVTITLQMFCLLNSQTNACEPNPKTTCSNFNRWKSVRGHFYIM